MEGIIPDVEKNSPEIHAGKIGRPGTSRIGGRFLVPALLVTGWLL
jgi:hypothetical protein